MAFKLAFSAALLLPFFILFNYLLHFSLSAQAGGSEGVKLHQFTIVIIHIHGISTQNVFIIYRSALRSHSTTSTDDLQNFPIKQWKYCCSLATETYNNVLRGEKSESPWYVHVEEREEMMDGLESLNDGNNKLMKVLIVCDEWKLQHRESLSLSPLHYRQSTATSHTFLNVPGKSSFPSSCSTKWIAR